MIELSSRYRQFATAFASATVLLAPVAIMVGYAGNGNTANGLSRVDRYGITLFAYATVRRSDGTYRRMLTTTDALAAARSNSVLPDGTRIFMESYYRPGEPSTVFHMMKQQGKWGYGSFTSNTDLNVRPQASCLSCHAGAATTDFVYTLPSLKAAASGKGASEFSCNRGGRAPCSRETYTSAPPR